MGPVNAHTSIAIRPQLPREAFEGARDSVNAWRGRCLDAFTRAEAGVTETLLLMSASGERRAHVGLPHLVGQRFEALATAIIPAEARQQEKAVAATLSDFRAYENIRTMLCHGVASIALNQHGRWTLVIRLLALRARKPSRDVLVIEEEEAVLIAGDICKASQRLCSQLGTLRAALKASPPKPASERPRTAKP